LDRLGGDPCDIGQGGGQALALSLFGLQAGCLKALGEGFGLQRGGQVLGGLGAAMELLGEVGLALDLAEAGLCGLCLRSRLRSAAER
jgi:hypothetical protein